MKDKNQNYRTYFTRLLAIAVPLILSNVINQVQMLIDRIFLGQANTLYMAVLGNSSSPLWTTMSVCFSIATGASILISQSVGAKDDKKKEEYSGALLKYSHILPFALFLLWFFGSRPVFRLLGVSDKLIGMCADYARYSSPVFLLLGLGCSFTVIFQTSNHTKHLAIWSVLRSAFNIFLDWLLIFGNLGFPAMGIKGAALGTAIAEYLGGLYLTFAYFKSGKLGTRPSMPAVKEAKVKSYLISARLGINTALEDFCWNLGNLAIIRILNSINELAAGIYSIIFSVEVLAVVVIGSLGNGTLTLASEAVGQSDKKQFKGVCVAAYTLSLAVTLAMLCASILCPRWIISVFTKDRGIIATSGIYLLLISINLISKSGNIIIGSAIRGSGDTRWMFFTQLFGTFFVIACACFFVYSLKLGITGVFLAVIADEGVRFAVNFGKFMRIYKKSPVFGDQEEIK